MADATITIKADDAQFKKSTENFGKSLAKELESSFSGLKLDKLTISFSKLANGKGGAAAGAASGLAGSALSGAVAGTAMKLLGSIADSLSDFPVVVAIFRLFKLIMMLLFLPLIPVLVPALKALASFASSFANTMKEIAGTGKTGIATSADVASNKLSSYAQTASNETLAKTADTASASLSTLSTQMGLVWDSTKELVSALKPVWDFLKLIAGFAALGALTILNGALFVFNLAIQGLAVILESAQNLFIQVSDGVTNVFKAFEVLKAWLWVFEAWIRTAFLTVWKKLGEVFNTLWSKISSIVEKIVSLSKKIGGGVSSVASSIWSGAKKAIGVEDAIISPNGNIISTSPSDYLIATKNPSSLAGGGGMTININVTNPSIRNKDDIDKLVQQISRATQQGMRRYVSYGNTGY